MSWQAYVDNLLQTKTMIHAGIFGLDGSTWAASPGFPVCNFLFFFLNLSILIFKSIIYLYNFF